MTDQPVDPHPASAEIASLDATSLGALLDAGELTSVEVVEGLIARIEALDGGATGLHSFIEVSHDARDMAAALDAERRAGRRRGDLHGIPVLVKDNIDTVAPLHTTAGSLVFGESSPAVDAPLVSALRDAGALVIGKANLSEWANFRGTRSSSGWSAVGGQTRNPHALDRSPGGSSAGSGAAVAARLVPLAIGTETDGSIMCPSAACGIAGLKPTLGLVSRTGIVPISATQDTAGPMARSARDLALLLSVLAGAVDDGEDDAATLARRPPGYGPAALRGAFAGSGNLAGLRVGLVSGRGYTGYHRPTDDAVGAALDALAGAGAELVDPVEDLPPSSTWEQDELTVLLHEFQVYLEGYLRRRAEATDGSAARSRNGTDARLPRTLEDVLAHAADEAGERSDLFPIDLISRAAATDGLDSDGYRQALRRIKQATRADGLDKIFAGGVDVLALPAMSPAWPIDHVLGDQTRGAGWSVSAVAGYPSATLPVGKICDVPVGVALLGPAWSEPLLLRVMGALEGALGSAVTSPVPNFASGLTIEP